MTIKYSPETEKSVQTRHCFTFSADLCREIRWPEGIKPSVSFVGGLQLAFADDEEGKWSLRRTESGDYRLRIPVAAVPEIPTGLSRGECGVYEQGRGLVKVVLPESEEFSADQEKPWPMALLEPTDDAEEMLQQIALLQKEIAIRSNQLGSLLARLGYAKPPEYAHPIGEELT